jgi:hypothetical protein
MTTTFRPAEIAPIATRMQNAYDGLVTNLVELGGINDVEAGMVADLYIRKRLVRLDMVGGRYNVKHGAYFDRAVILNALDAACAS